MVDEELFADVPGHGLAKGNPADFVDFGWADDEDKKLTGRRKKLQRKAKPGSFGERQRAGLADSGRPGMSNQTITALPACLLSLARRDYGIERTGSQSDQAQGLPPANPDPAQDAAADPAGAAGSSPCPVALTLLQHFWIILDCSIAVAACCASFICVHGPCLPFKLPQGLDVVGMARTGSGKTAAFVVPLIERLKEHSVRAGARSVILSPTRELALQTHKVVKELGRHTNLRTAGAAASCAANCCTGAGAGAAFRQRQHDMQR